MPDTVLHELTTERGTYRLVSTPEACGVFGYIMLGNEKLGEILWSEREKRFLVNFYKGQSAPVVLDAGRLVIEHEASYLARV